MAGQVFAMELHIPLLLIPCPNSPDQERLGKLETRYGNIYRHVARVLRDMAGVGGEGLRHNQAIQEVCSAAGRHIPQYRR